MNASAERFIGSDRREKQIMGILQEYSIHFSYTVKI